MIRSFLVCDASMGLMLKSDEIHRVGLFCLDHPRRGLYSMLCYDHWEIISNLNNRSRLA